MGLPKLAINLKIARMEQREDPMNLNRVFQQFPDHESCVAHLEKVRWNDNPHCPRCDSARVAPKADGNRIGRWNCHNCHASFNVLSGTIFQGTRVPLQKWFLAISLILNAKKILSSYQLARDLDLNQKTAWYLAMRVRNAMVEERELLIGVVDMEECHIGDKSCHPNNRSGHRPERRGCGTSKLRAVGAAERGGKVVANPSLKVAGRELPKVVRHNVDSDALLITDEYDGFRGMHRQISHATVDHKPRYVDGLARTYTFEGFWALLKRVCYGQHHHLCRQYSATYIAEAAFKYNFRDLENPSGALLRGEIRT